MPKTMFFRVFWSVTTVLVCTAILFIAMVSVHNVKLIVRNDDANAKALLQIYNDDMNDLLAVINSIHSLLSNHPTLLVVDEAEQSQILKSHYEAANGSFISLLLLDVQGNMVAGYPRQNFSITLPRTSYEQAIIRRGNVDYIFVPAIHPETKRLSGHIVAVLNYADGLVMSSIRSFASPPLDFFALEGDGTVVAHNNSDRIGKGWAEKGVVFEGKRMYLGDFLASLPKGIFHLNYELGGVPQRGTFVYNENYDLLFGTSRPLETVKSALVSIWRDLFWMLLIILVLMALISLYLSHSVTRPTKALEQYVSELSVFNTPHDYKTENETKELRGLRVAFERTISALNEAHFSVVKVLTKAVEEKDAYTQGHAERVTEISMQIAEQMSLDSREKHYLRYAAILHDVGKLAVPEQLLTKQQNVNEREWEIIRQHPSTSKSIVEQSDFLQSSVPGIYHHHERFDGDGYPSGLKGEEIPLYARIIAVADAYDAMTTDRPYRKAISDFEAIERIKQESGRHFDPKVVAAFLALIPASRTLSEVV